MNKADYAAQGQRDYALVIAGNHYAKARRDSFADSVSWQARAYMQAYAAAAGAALVSVCEEILEETAPAAPLAIASYRTGRTGANGRPVQAIAIFRGHEGAVLSLPAHLNGGRIPEIDEAESIMRGDSIRTASAVRKMIAFEYFDGAHKGVVQYDVPTGDYFARTYEAVSDDETGLISWAFCDSLGMHEDLFAAIAAIQGWFGVALPEENEAEEDERIARALRALAALEQNRQRAVSLRCKYMGVLYEAAGEQFHNGYATLRKHHIAITALRIVRHGYGADIARRWIADAADAAAVLAMAVRLYETDMQRWPADLRQREARKTWANAFSFAREHANLI